MARKPTWKSIHIQSSDQVRQLASCWGSSKGAFKGYIWNLDKSGGGAYLETNLPYRHLRQLFSHSQVPFPRDHVTDTMPLEERAKEWE